MRGEPVAFRQLGLRIPVSLSDRIEQYRKLTHMSKTAFVIYCIQQYITQTEISVTNEPSKVRHT